MDTELYVFYFLSINAYTSILNHFTSFPFTWKNPCFSQQAYDIDTVV